MSEALFVGAADFDDDSDLSVGSEFCESFDVDVVEGGAELSFEVFEVDGLVGRDGCSDAAGEADVFLHDVAGFCDGGAEDDQGEDDEDCWDDEHRFVVFLVDAVEVGGPAHGVCGLGWCLKIL